MTAVLPTLGSAALVAALVTYVLSWLAYRGIDPKTPEPGLQKARKNLFYALASLGIASLALLWLLFARAYQVEYVYAHVSNDLPGLNVLSAFWAGQEGSFLIWALLAAVLGWLLTRQAGEWEVPVMKVYLPSAAVLVALVLFTGLFKLLPQTPVEGAGLNPLLRDPWMAIHPPVTFLGYAALSIPFAFAMASFGRKGSGDWVEAALPWSLLGWATLGTGIIMGGYWAYKVLGWGGWWGWDPVENASLLPWLLGMALFHGLLLQRARKKLARTNVILAVLTFALVIYSTFLTRSGVLEGASVHTFGASPAGTWLFIWIVAILGYGFYRIAGDGGGLKGEKLEESFFSREMQLLIGAIVIIGITIMVGLGTSAPILSRISGGEGAAIDISYYGRTTLPLAIIMAFGLGISVLRQWRGGDLISRNALPVSIAAAVAGAIGAALLGVNGALSILFAGGSAMALVANLFVFQHTLVNNGWKLTGGPLSHIGAALMLIAVVAATTGTKATTGLIYEQPTEVMGYELTFVGWNDEPGGKRSTSVTLSRPGESGSILLKPKLYQQYGSGQVMVRAEPHIDRGLLGDLYLAPAQYLPPADAIAGSGNILDLGKGESADIGGATLTFEDYDMGGHEPAGMTAGSIGARVRVDWEDGSETVTPRWGVSGEQPPAVDLPYGVEGQLKMQGIDADRGRVNLLYLGGEVPADGRAVGGLLTVELSEKPLMGILWLGVLIVLAGGAIAVLRRLTLPDQEA